MGDTTKEKLISEKKFTDINYGRLKIALSQIQYNLIHSDFNMYLIVNSLIKISNTIINSSNINLREVIVKPYVFDKIYNR